jgi:hypothetical protein
MEKRRRRGKCEGWFYFMIHWMWLKNNDGFDNCCYVQQHSVKIEKHILLVFFFALKKLKWYYEKKKTETIRTTHGWEMLNAKRSFKRWGLQITSFILLFLALESTHPKDTSQARTSWMLQCEIKSKIIIIITAKQTRDVKMSSNIEYWKLL